MGHIIKHDLLFTWNSNLVDCLVFFYLLNMVTLFPESISHSWLLPAPQQCFPLSLIATKPLPQISPDSNLPYWPSLGPSMRPCLWVSSLRHEEELRRGWAAGVVVSGSKNSHWSEDSGCPQVSKGSPLCGDKRKWSSHLVSGRKG